MTGYIYHLIKVGTAEVLDQTSIDERDVNLATDLFCNEFGYKEQFDNGDVAVVFSHTEEEEDHEDFTDEEFSKLMADAGCGDAW